MSNFLERKIIVQNFRCISQKLRYLTDGETRNLVRYASHLYICTYAYFIGYALPSDCYKVRSKLYTPCLGYNDFLASHNNIYWINQIFHTALVANRHFMCPATAVDKHGSLLGPWLDTNYFRWSKSMCVWVQLCLYIKEILSNLNFPTLTKLLFIFIFTTLWQYLNYACISNLWWLCRYWSCSASTESSIMLEYCIIIVQILCILLSFIIFI